MVLKVLCTLNSLKRKKTCVKEPDEDLISMYGRSTVGSVPVLMHDAFRGGI